MYVMRHACRHRGQQEYLRRDSTTVLRPEKHKNVSQITNRYVKSFTLMATFSAAKITWALTDRAKSRAIVLKATPTLGYNAGRPYYYYYA